MAIIVDCVALIYLLLITYDEYSSKPLGLRSPSLKMRLILLDLFFVVFNAANLGLAFDALTDTRWSCRPTSDPPSTLARSSGPDEQLCARQQALSAVLLIALVTWLLTFAVTAFR